MKRLVTFSWILMLIIPVASFGQSDTLGILMEKISRLRVEISKIDTQINELTSLKMQLESKLEDLASRIQARKTAGPQDALLPDFKLQDMLRDSHETSDRLNSILKQLDVLGDDQKAEQEKLSQVRQLMLVEVETALKNASDDEKAVLFGLLNDLREDQGMVERSNDNLPTPPPMNTNELLDTNDPEELQERADAIQDEQDRLRRGLAELEKKIELLRDKRRIDRQMRDFQKDQLLFAERSRVFQLMEAQTVTALDGNIVENDGSQPPNGTDLKDPIRSDLFEPCVGASCEAITESMLDSKIHQLSVSKTQGQVEGSKNKGKDTGHMSTLDKMRILTKAREDTIHQIKRLQIIYDRVMEKAEDLEKN